MNLENEIRGFHESINYRLEQQSLSTLQYHGIKRTPIDKGNRKQLKVRAFHYQILSTSRSVNSPEMFKSEGSDWEGLTGNSLYFEKELQEFALQCLYLTNTPLGECVVQRNGKRDVAVVQLKKLTARELLKTEQLALQYELEKSHLKQTMTFGADLELMFQNEITKRFMNGGELTTNEFGYDQAVAVHQNRVFHPIIEIRPKPSAISEELHNNLLVLYQKVINQTSKFHLNINTNPNPLSRFFLGGHIHFGNVPFTFQHVRLLDQFVAIPFAIAEVEPSFIRRKNYGRLGSVRRNSYKGFEYRVLPTWFHLIPISLPLLEWIEYIMKNAYRLDATLFEENSLKRYYDQRFQDFSIDQWAFKYREYIVEEKGKLLFDNFVTYLKKL
ncbi:putative amidoligase domain-containing protein [Anaerobacillus isosaccharinicus]|uniref:Uncharacterized protein n=2 Tax=Anaerobacillus isosaccharinicus TaxID=1532552 RepID=A0A1S2M8G0_9BACI|nr:hypothetical protein [Anaerobacillus isosaccharinicus]